MWRDGEESAQLRCCLGSGTSSSPSSYTFPGNKFSLSTFPLMFARGDASRRCGAATPVLPPLPRVPLAGARQPRPGSERGWLPRAAPALPTAGDGWGKVSSLQPCCLLLLDFPGGFTPNINNTPSPASCSPGWHRGIAVWGCPWSPQPQNFSVGWAGGAAGGGRGGISAGEVGTAGRGLAGCPD